MSFPFSPGSGDSISDLNGPECQSSDSASSTENAGQSLNGIGPESPAQITSPDSTKSGWQAWDSLNHTASPEVPTLGQNTGMATGRAGVIFRFFDPSRTLMPDGQIMENWKEQQVANALTRTSGGGTKAPAIVSNSSAADSRARTCQSPENAPDLTGNDPASSSKQPESLTLFSDPEGGSSLRTFPDFFPATAAGISESFSRRWPTSGFTTSPGECWTADTSECPKGGGEFSSLPGVLQAEVPVRFFLSPKAAAGILRRANKRGRALPEPLDRGRVRGPRSGQG